MRHPHADLIKQWADDISLIVERLESFSESWYEVRASELTEFPATTFRLSEKPFTIFANISPIGSAHTSERLNASVHNLRLEFEMSSGKLIKAEVL